MNSTQLIRLLVFVLVIAVLFVVGWPLIAPALGAAAPIVLVILALIVILVVLRILGVF